MTSRVMEGHIRSILLLKVLEFKDNFVKYHTAFLKTPKKDVILGHLIWREK